MKVRRVLSYVLIVGVFVAAIVAVVQYGGGIDGRRDPSTSLRAGAAQPAPGTAALRTLLVQVVLTLLCAYGLGWVARRVGQPSVIGELAGGIALGPTVLGHLWPAAFHLVFPADSLGALKLLADVGVIFFMFAVGLEVDLRELRGATHRAVAISHASIVVPFLIGVLAALPLHRTYAPPGTSFAAFALFTGIAMAITAFPVLARILIERGMAATPLGAMALTCAAVDDITAWGLLAFVVALVRGHSPREVLTMVLLTIAFVAFMLRVVRPLLARMRIGDMTLILIMFASAAFTEAIGMHAVFGAFLAGVILPLDPEARRRCTERLSIITPALLPLFFAYVGVRTELTLIRDLGSAMVCLAIIVLATIGKLGGSAVAGRITGMPWRDALALGALMNTRGLMQLVAVNIAYDLGILTPAMFAILIVMAIVTTVATGPLLTLFNRSA